MNKPFATLLKSKTHELQAQRPTGSTALERVTELESLRAQVAQAQDRERAWQAVSDTARDLTVLREPQLVLRAIVERGRALLGSHVAWIASPDTHHGDDLVVQAIDGVSTEWAQQMRAASGRGVVGYVRQTRSPFATSDYYSEQRVVHDVNIDATLRREGVQSMVAVPMLSGADLLGVLVVADRASRDYTHPDIAALGTLAAHAVVAMLNAQAFAQTRAALAQAEQSNSQLQQHMAALELAAETHERLTRLVAHGATLAEVCRTVSSLLEATVVLLDEVDSVVCSAEPERPQAGAIEEICVATLLPGLALHADLDNSRMSGRSVCVTDAKLSAAGRWAGQIAAIVAGNRLLGGLLVLSPSPLSEVARRTLERSAMVIAVMLLAPGRLPESSPSRPQALLLDLLNPLRAGSAALARQAAAHGLLNCGSPVLALLQAKGPSDGAVMASLLRGLKDRLDPRRTLIGELDGLIAVMVCGDSPTVLRETLGQALDEIRSTTVIGLVSAPCGELASLPLAMASLQRGLVLLQRLGRTGGIRLEVELAPYSAAFAMGNLPDGIALKGFINAMIGPLVLHDRLRSASLARSLLTYLDLGYNARAAAAKLGVHVNTMNQRLAAAAALVGSWDAPGRGFELHMALRLAALQGFNSNAD